MGYLAFFDLASIGSALLWPLAAGVAVVVWSRARAAARTRKMALIDAQLQGFYRTLEAKPAPAHLSMVLDALEEGQELAGPTRKLKAATTADS